MSSQGQCISPLSFFFKYYGSYRPRYASYCHVLLYFAHANSSSETHSSRSKSGVHSPKRAFLLLNHSSPLNARVQGTDEGIELAPSPSSCAASFSIFGTSASVRPSVRTRRYRHHHHNFAPVLRSPFRIKNSWEFRRPVGAGCDRCPRYLRKLYTWTIHTVTIMMMLLLKYHATGWLTSSEERGSMGYGYAGYI